MDQLPSFTNFFDNPQQDPTKQKALMDYFQQVSQMNPQKQQYMRSRAMAEQLRKGAEMPGMRTMRAAGGDKGGTIAVAAHPLEFLSSLAHAGAGAYREMQADKGEDAYGQGRRDVFGALRKKMFPDPEDPTKQQPTPDY